MLIEEPFFTLRIRRDLSPEQWNEVASALCRIAIDPPRPVVELRRVAILAAMNLYSGSRSARAKRLEREYRRYLAGPWRLERDLESLPDPRVAQHVLLHRLARLGAPSGWRQLFDVANSADARDVRRI
jgi:hypothetical protein